MPGNNRNRNSQKEKKKEMRSGNNSITGTGYRKLPDNSKNAPDEGISTTDNTADDQ